jgi:hypothetical protein
LVVICKAIENALYCFRFSRDHRPTQHVGAPRCKASFEGS